MKNAIITLYLILLIPFSIAHANESEDKPAEETPEYLYFGFDPELVTNYISSRGSMGYVRTSIDLVVKLPSELSLLEYHEPLLRATLLEILGGQPEEKIKSLSGREAIRKECKNMLNKLLKQETGESPIVNLLLTRYLYD